MSSNQPDHSTSHPAHHLFTSFQRAQQTSSSRLWDLFSIAQLNAAFMRELLAANRTNKKAIDGIYEDLQAVAVHSDEVSSHAQASIQPLEATHGSFEETRQTVESFVGTLNRLQVQFGRIRSAFHGLNETIERIAGTLSEIDNVSELTHLLSLNASVEAARAGSYGVGFKVVAEEIKKLSDRSARLTEETNSLLKGAHQAVSQGLEDLGGYDELRAGVDENLRHTQDQLQEQAQRIDTVDRNVRGIVEDIQQQSERTGRIRERMDALHRSASVATDAADHVSSSLEHQDRAIEALRRLDGEQRAMLREHRERLADQGALSIVGDAVVVGHDVAYPPWVSVMDGESSGISIDLVRQVGNRTNRETLFEAGEFADVLDSFLAGTIRVLANIGWPNAVFEDKPVITSRAYASFRPSVFTLDTPDLEPFHTNRGRRIAVQRGSYVADAVQAVGATVVPVDNDLHGMAKVMWREVDGLATETRVGEHLSHRFFDDRIVSTGQPIATVDVVLVFHQDDTELRDQFNEALRPVE